MKNIDHKYQGRLIRVSRDIIETQNQIAKARPDLFENLSIPKKMLAKLNQLCTFKKLPGQGTIHREMHRVIGFQRSYNGELCYRVICVSWNDSFGRVMSSSEAIWITTN